MKLCLQIIRIVLDQLQSILSILKFGRFRDSLSPVLRAFLALSIYLRFPEVHVVNDIDLYRSILGEMELTMGIVSCVPFHAKQSSHVEAMTLHRQYSVDQYILWRISWPIITVAGDPCCRQHGRSEGYRE